MAQFPSLLAQTPAGQLLPYAEGKIYDVNDLAKSTPLSITDLNGLPIPGGSLIASDAGILPPFRYPGKTIVSWVSEPYRMDIPAVDILPTGGEVGQVLAKGSDGGLVWQFVSSGSTPGSGSGAGPANGDYWNRSQTAPVIVIAANAPWPTSAPEGALIVRLSGTGA